MNHIGYFRGLPCYPVGKFECGKTFRGEVLCIVHTECT